MDTEHEENAMSDQQSTAPLTGFRPETQALMATVTENMPSQQTDEFTRLDEGLFNVQVCTSLSDEDATARVNLIPAGTRNGWFLCTEADQAPVPCADRPETHRHLLFEA